MRLVKLALLTLAAPLAAQSPQAGDYVVTDYGSTTVFVVTPAGNVTTRHVGAPLTSPSGIAVTQARDVIIADYNSGTLFRMGATGAPTPVIRGLAGPIRCAVDRDGSYLVSELTAPALSRVTPAGVRSVIHQGTPFVRPIGMTVDTDGTYLVADDSVRALFRVSPTGVTVVHQGLPFRLPQGVTVLGDGDYAVFDGLADSVFVVPRAGGSVRTLVAPPTLGNPCGIDADFEGGVVCSESSAANNRIVRVDRNGNLQVIAQGTGGNPFSNLEVVAHVPTLSGPTRGQSNQSHALDLHMPAQANRIYVLFASASLLPGIQLGAADPRATPCNADGLFFASIGAGNAVFSNFLGNLSPTGQASASLNVPNISLAGLTLYLQGFAVNFRQPSGIGEFSNVHALGF